MSLVGQNGTLNIAGCHGRSAYGTTNGRATVAVELAIAVSNWVLGKMVGVVTIVVMFVADSFSEAVREEKQEPQLRADHD